MTILIKLTDGRQVHLSKCDVLSIEKYEDTEPSETTVMRFISDNGFFQIQEDDFVYFPNSIAAIFV